MSAQARNEMIGGPVNNQSSKNQIIHWSLQIGAILAVVFIAYFGALSNGFVTDDNIYVLGNPQVTGKATLREIFTSTYPPNHPEQGLYRPIVTLSYLADFKFWHGFFRADRFNGFHLTNLLIHSINSILLLVLLSKLGLSTRTRFLSAILYAAHPALSEAVIWIVGRAELLSATFGLIGLIILLHRPNLRGILGFAACWVLSMLCKESGFSFAAIAPALVWYQFSQTESKTQKTPFRWIEFVISIIVAGAIFLTLRTKIIGSWHPAMAAYEGVVSTPIRMVTALGTLLKYILLWFWPHPLTIYHAVAPASSIAAGIPALIAWFVLVFLAWKLLKKFPWFALATFWFCTSIFIVSNLVVPIGAVFGERFAYTPLMLFAPCTILALEKFCSKFLHDDKSPMPAAVTLVVVLIFGALIWLRTPDWKSNVTLWESALKVSPDSFAVKAPLSEAYLLAGKFDKAQKLASSALDQLQNQPEVYRKLFVSKLENIDAQAKNGASQQKWLDRFMAANQDCQNLKLQEAMVAYKEIIRDYPEQPETFEALGDLYVRLNNPVGALQNFTEALRLGLKSSQLFAKYGQVLSELGKKAEAAIAYEDALKINPKDYLIHYNHGIVMAELEDYTGALQAFRQANELSPTFAAPRVNSAAILIHLKRYDEAKKEINLVIAGDPKLKQDLTKEAKKLLQRIPPS